MTDQGGCGYFRAQLPAMCLKRRGHRVSLIAAEGPTRVCSSWIAGADVLILQRSINRDWRNMVEMLLPDNRPMIVYECDDLITDLDAENPAHAEFAPHDSKMVQCLLSCDGVITSTETLGKALKRRIQSPTPPFEAVRNYLDYSQRNWVYAESKPHYLQGRTVIGWAGAESHYEDDRPIRTALTEVLRERRDCCFAMCSHPNLQKAWRGAMPGIRDEQWINLPPREFQDYPSLLSSFDIGIAPIRDTPFNRCKSDLKLMEYGTWSIPVIASDLPPYRGFIRETGGGLLCGNRDEWKQAILQYLDDPGLRREHGSRNYRYVTEQRSEDSCGREWEDALIRLREDHLCRIQASRTKRVA